MKLVLIRSLSSCLSVFSYCCLVPLSVSLSVTPLLTQAQKTTLHVNASLYVCMGFCVRLQVCVCVCARARVRVCCVRVCVRAHTHVFVFVHV